MAATQAVFYRDKRGVEPVNKFIDRLLDKQAAKIDHYIDEYLNNQPPAAPPPEFLLTSQLKGELRDLRIRFGSTYFRVLYQRSGNLVVLLHIVEKKSRQLPVRDIELAQKRFIDFRARMNKRPRQPPRAAGTDAPKTRKRP